VVSGHEFHRFNGAAADQLRKGECLV